MKHVWYIWMMAALITVTSAGCGNQVQETEPVNETAGIVLTVSMPSPEWGSYGDQLAAMYQKDHPEITEIRWNLVDRSMYFDLLRVSLASQKLPDIIYVGFDSAMEEWKDHLLPLNDSKALQQMPVRYAGMGALDGIVYSVPLQIQGLGIAYNKELLRKVGWDHIPETKTEFISLCEALEAEEIKPVMNHYKETLLTMASNLFMLPAMGEEDPAAYMEGLLQEGRQQEYEESWLALADYFDLSLKYGNRDSLTTGVYTARDYFFIGKYAMLNDEGSWLAPVIRKEKPALEDQITLGCIPLYEEAERNRLLVEVQALSVVKSSEHTAEAAQFLDWLTSSKEAVEFLKQNMGCLPVASMNDDSTAGLSPMAASVKEMMLNDKTCFDTVNCLPEELRNKSAELWGKYLAGDLNRDQVLQDYQSLWNNYMNENQGGS